MAEWVDFKKIKADITIEAVLSHYGLLDKMRQKGDKLIGACPIHKGTNANQFNASRSKNIYNCFGDCGGGGNIVDFVCKMEDVEPRKAGLLLQKWFNIQSEKPTKKDTGAKPDTGNDKGKETKKDVEPEEKSKAKKEEEKPPENAKANEPLKFSLTKLDPKHPYLEERGLEPETIEAFGAGYCSSGIMKGRIAIPICNKNGELVAYVGRWPSDEPPENEAKYKLPANFHKSLEVFNLYRFVDSMIKDRGVIIVEGYFDCMRLHQAGYDNAVALMGSSLSEEQEKLIVEAVGLGGKVVLLLDGDKAGRGCRDDVLVRLASKVFARVVNLPDGKQPDNLSSTEIKELLE